MQVKILFTPLTFNFLSIDPTAVGWIELKYNFNLQWLHSKNIAAVYLWLSSWIYNTSNDIEDSFSSREFLS